MTNADRIKIEIDKIIALFPAPDYIDTIAAARKRSAAQLRFIAKAFEQMEEGLKLEDAERADKR